jgi:hypothetical protein
MLAEIESKRARELSKKIAEIKCIINDKSLTKYYKYNDACEMKQLVKIFP